MVLKGRMSAYVHPVEEPRSVGMWQKSRSRGWYDYCDYTAVPDKDPVDRMGRFA